MRGCCGRAGLARLVASLLLLASRRCAAYAPFFADSKYAAARTWDAPRVPTGLDAAADDAVDRIVSRIAHRGEIILFHFTATGWWLTWAVNFYKQLEAVGYQHHVGLAFEDACVAVQAELPWAACVSYTLEGDHWVFEQNSIDYGWIGRYLLASRLARAGVNVLVLDMDSILRRDLYAPLHLPPHSSAALVHQEEGFANGGVFYLRAPADGPAGWTHDEVWRRADAVKRMAHEPGGFSGTAMDQALLNDALNGAASPNGSAFDWPSTYVTGAGHHSHPFWNDPHTRRGERSRRGPGDRWYAVEWARAEQGAAGEASAAAAASACGPACGPGTPCAGAAAAHGREPWKTLALRVPADAPERAAMGAAADRVETFAAGLQLTFGNSMTERAGCGLSAVTHLVGAAAEWGEQGDWAHSGRRALMAAAGAWLPAPLGAARYVSVSDTLVAEGGTATKTDVARTLRRLFHAAHELGRVPMVFGFPCDAPWLARGPHALLGVYDHRVVKHGGLCYPAPGGQRCWWDTHVYAFEVPQDTVAPRTLRAFDEARAHGASHEVHLRHLPELTQPVNDKLRQDCHKWFED